VCWGLGRCDYKKSAIYSTCTRTVLVLKSKLKKSTQKVNGYCASTCTLYTHSTTYEGMYEGTKYESTFESTFVPSKVLSYYCTVCRARFFRFFFPAPSELLRFFGQLEANRGELDSLRSTDRRGMSLAVSR
jgi:hypothetical protein